MIKRRKLEVPIWHLKFGIGLSLNQSIWHVHSADLHAFLVLAEASKFYADFQVSMKPTVGALCILDARSGRVLHPLSRWGLENWPDRITAVQGTRLVAIACSTYENHALRDKVLVFEVDRYRGVLEHRTSVDRRPGDWSVASNGPDELTLRWPGASPPRAEISLRATVDSICRVPDAT